MVICMNQWGPQDMPVAYVHSCVWVEGKAKQNQNSLRKKEGNRGCISNHQCPTTSTLIIILWSIIRMIIANNSWEFAVVKHCVKSLSFIYLSIYLPIYLSVCLPICLSVYNLSILWFSFSNKISEVQKGQAVPKGYKKIFIWCTEIQEKRKARFKFNRVFLSKKSKIGI